MSHRYRAIIFDMNGVIVDDESLHEMAFAEALSPLGVALTHRDYLEYFAGRTDTDGFLAFLAKTKKDADVERLLLKKAKAYQVLAAKGLQAYPGVIDFIHDLKGSALPLALVTGATQEETQIVLGSFGLSDDFVTVLTAADITEGKPSPQGYMRASERLGVSTKECIVIEDSPAGIQAAKRAGMYCVAVTHTHNSRELAQADLIVEGFDGDSRRSILDLIG